MLFCIIQWIFHSIMKRRISQHFKLLLFKNRYKYLYKNAKFEKSSSVSTYISYLFIRGVSDVGFSIFADTDADADFAF